MCGELHKNQHFKLHIRSLSLDQENLLPANATEILEETPFTWQKASFFGGI